MPPETSFRRVLKLRGQLKLCSCIELDRTVAIRYGASMSGYRAMHRCAALAFALTVGWGVAHAQQRASLQAACWAPSALAATAGERTPVRLQRPAPRPPSVAEVSTSTLQMPMGAIRRV